MRKLKALKYTRTPKIVPSETVKPGDKPEENKVKEGKKEAVATNEALVNLLTDINVIESDPKLLTINKKVETMANKLTEKLKASEDQKQLTVQLLDSVYNSVTEKKKPLADNNLFKGISKFVAMQPELDKNTKQSYLENRYPKSKKEKPHLITNAVEIGLLEDYLHKCEEENIVVSESLKNAIRAQKEKLEKELDRQEKQAPFSRGNLLDSIKEGKTLKKTEGPKELSLEERRKREIEENKKLNEHPVLNNSMIKRILASVNEDDEEDDEEEESDNDTWDDDEPVIVNKKEVEKIVTENNKLKKENEKLHEVIKIENKDPIVINNEGNKKSQPLDLVKAMQNRRGKVWRDDDDEEESEDDED